MPRCTQHLMEPGRAVEAPVLQEHRLDLSGKPGALGRPTSRRLLPFPQGLEATAAHRQLAALPGRRVLSGELIDQAKPLGASGPCRKRMPCEAVWPSDAAASLREASSLLSSRFSCRSRLRSAGSTVVNRPWSRGPAGPLLIRLIRAWRIQHRP